MHIAATLMIALLVIWPTLLKADQVDEVIDYLVAQRKGELQTDRKQESTSSSTNDAGKTIQPKESTTPTK